MATQNILYAGKNTTDEIAAKIKQLFAPLNSPALTGTPTATTPAEGDNSTRIATTAFVQNAISGITSALVFKGTVNTVANLPSLAGEVRDGDVYNIKTKGTSTADFVEGAGKVIDAGTNVGCVTIDGTKKWDILGGTFDTSELEALIDTKVTAVTSMPQQPKEGETVLWIAATTSDYTQGCVYKYTVGTWTMVCTFYTFTEITKAYVDSLFV